MELIKRENNLSVLDAETAQKIAEFERMAKEIKEKEDALKKAILAEMEEKSVLKLETDELLLSYVGATTRESLDSKALREELPDIYDTYVKISPVKSSIRIKLK